MIRFNFDFLHILIFIKYGVKILFKLIFFINDIFYTIINPTKRINKNVKTIFKNVH